LAEVFARRGKTVRQGALAMATDKTMTFSLGSDREREIRLIMQTVYDALREKGYNPVNQIVGYILSEDPTYITTHNNARSLIRKIDRDTLLQSLVKYYIAHNERN
jgi:uncharacterized protein (UPF0297 family)